MRQRLFANGCAIALGVGLVSGCKERLPVNAQRIDWPSLSEYNCTTGRPATEADVHAGRAVFVVSGGRPVPIRLPQYAFHIDQETRRRTPCIVIQAEEASGMKLVGCRELPAGPDAVGLLDEFELLGSHPPNHHRCSRE
jgi:hypothetical protein